MARYFSSVSMTGGSRVRSSSAAGCSRPESLREQVPAGVARGSGFTSAQRLLVIGPRVGISSAWSTQYCG